MHWKQRLQIREKGCTVAFIFLTLLVKAPFKDGSTKAPRYPDDLGREAFPCSILLNLDPNDEDITDYHVDWGPRGILDGFGQRVLRVTGPAGTARHFVLSAAATAPPTAFFSVLARAERLKGRRPVGRTFPTLCFLARASKNLGKTPEDTRKLFTALPKAQFRSCSCAR